MLRTTLRSARLPVCLQVGRFAHSLHTAADVPVRGVQALVSNHPSRRAREE